MVIKLHPINFITKWEKLKPLIKPLQALPGLRLQPCGVNNIKLEKYHAIEIKLHKQNIKSIQINYI